MLLLFDIDGTLLLGATDAHRDALQQALREVHGIDPRQARVVSPAGRTDGDIARSILLDAGIAAERIDERAEEVRERCCRRYAELCPGDLSSTVLPGVRDLLDRLSARDDLMLSLLTGNYEEVGRLKLERAGIGHYFASGQGAFGSDCEDRAALPAIARRRAGQLGRPHPRDQALVIGDTPRDIACARADGVRCVAVATGPYGIEQLEEADWAVQDATALANLLPKMLSD